MSLRLFTDSTRLTASTKPFDVSNGDKTKTTDVVNVQELIPFLLLAIQFGLQPTLNKNFIAKEVSSTVLIIVTELFKIVLSSIAIILVTPSDKIPRISASLSLPATVIRAGIPAFLYSVQNWLILLGSKHISALSMSLLNQTKTLSAALFAYILLGKKQSPQQLIALVGLFIGASLIVSTEQQSNKLNITKGENWIGLLAVASASLLSGVSSAASERALSKPIVDDIPAFASSLVFSIELAILGIVSLVLSGLLGLNPDTKHMFFEPFNEWTIFTLIPVLANASGGILVGVVTQRAGGVKKGFSLIFGIILATIVEALVGKKLLSLTHIAAVFCVLVSMWIYFSFPYQNGVVTNKTKSLKQQ